MPARRLSGKGIVVLPLAVVALACALWGPLPAGADLKDRIDAAKQEAEALETKIQGRGERIAALEAESAEAERRVRELTAELRAGEARSNELAADLQAAEKKLEASRQRLKRAERVLADRLVEIYKEGEVDYLDVLLSSDGFDDLTTRAEYLGEIERADSGVAERFRALNGEVADEVEGIEGLKDEIDDHNVELAAAQDEVAKTKAELEDRGAEVRRVKAAESADLDQMRSKVADLVAQTQSAGEQFGPWSGEWAIPTYIVMCESGGNYRALNESSGAGGAYQIMPATWRGYGGKGLPHEAAPAEQDRIAGEIWARSGPSQWTCA